MTTAKSWYASKTIWGSIIAVAAAILSVIGFDMDEAFQAALVEVILQFVTVAGSLFAILGRLNATSQIE